jgi:zinc transport system substrate-binding protein
VKKLAFIILIFLQMNVYAKQNIIVSIVPQKIFVQKIAKDKADITVMVAPGSSPHSYEPKVSQMIELSKAELYFSIGIDFEDAWLDKFRSQNKELRFVDMGKDVKKIQKHTDAHEHHEHHDHAHHHASDPHIWTSPKNVAVMAKTIYEELSKQDPDNKQFYKDNLDTFLNEIKELDTQIKEILKDIKPHATFMAFHPAWEYFAHQYGLKQLAFRTEGKNPKPKEMIRILKMAKKEDVKVILTQPEFSDKSARTIAKESGIKVKKVSPLNPDWSGNLKELAKAIANK